MLPLQAITCRTACLKTLVACQKTVMWNPNTPETDLAIELASECMSACQLFLDNLCCDSENMGATYERCVEACDACALELAKHPCEFSRECVDACRTWSEVCRGSLAQSAA